MRSLLFPLLLSSSVQAATRHFTIDVCREQKSPDGVLSNLIVVNGTSPGPALVVDEGDDVEFLVRNYLDEKTAVHFHGIDQLLSPWSDGVGGLSQRPIPPGGEYLYKWNANEYGTYWYHAHYKCQVSDGFMGPIHVNPRPSEKRPFALISNQPEDLTAMMEAEKSPRLVMISDLTHLPSDQVTSVSEQLNIEIPCTNSILVNGKGSVNCLSQKQQEEALDPIFRPYFTNPETGEWIATPSGCSMYSPAIQGNFSYIFDGLPEALTECNETDSPLETIEVDGSKRWVSLNFIGATSIQAPTVSIDGHRMWIYAVDGRYIEPELVDGVTMYNGNRYSAMVELDQEPGQYTLRATQFGANQIINGFATLSYSSSPETVHHPTPHVGPAGVPSSGTKLLNAMKIRPFDNIPPERYRISQTHTLNATRNGAPWVWKLDEVSYPQLPLEFAEDIPLLYYPDSPEAHNESLVIRTNNGTWIDIIVVVAGLESPPHPLHKHSNKAYIIGSGINWRWNTVAEAAMESPESFNFENPPYRDGFTTPPVTPEGPVWLAIRYQVVNPGAFLLHCHIQPHLTGGMAVAFMDGVDVWPEIPDEYAIS